MTPPKRSNPKQEKGKKISPSSENRKTLPEQQKPIFSLHYLQKSHCLTNCDKEQKSAFADTLYKLSQLTWNQIASSSRHGAGYERISQNAIKAPIPSHLQSDVNLIAFRFCALAPMVGYREGNIFHVVWLDRAFTLYDHG